jgi:hypothetical protein
MFPIMQRMFRRHARSTALARFALATLAFALIASVSRTMNAQATDSAANHAPSDTSAVCLGFAFGRWTPPLDWHAAKHVGAMDSSAVGHAPGGRGWAAGDGEMPDSTLMLYPGWWPVGVTVALPTRAPVAGDTVSGIATALVADGRVRNPTAKVRAWRVPCAQAITTASPSREH